MPSPHPSRLAWIFLAAFILVASHCVTRVVTPTDTSRTDDSTFLICGDTPTVHTGEATYYTFANGSGNCCFDSTPNDLMVGAMNQADYDSSYICGSCVAVDGPDSMVDIRIVDRCPECAPGDIDLSPLAFALIAPIERGRVPISWHLIPCPAAGPIIYHFKDGSNQWWTAVQIRNHRYPIRSVEYIDSGGGFTEVPRTNYNYFVQTDGMGPGPYTFRVTDIYGHVLVDSGIVGGDNTDASGNAQFPQCD